MIPDAVWIRRMLLPAMLLVTAAGGAQTALLLWPQGAPQQTEAAGPNTVRITPQGEHVLTHVVAPSITPYLPVAGSATGAAVIIAPGGGHRELWIDHEGYRVAEYLSQHGVAAFVLTYRLALEEANGKSVHPPYTVDHTELGDMQRAIRVVRSRAAEWHIDPERIGVMGFSAGGELALLASTRYDTAAQGSGDTLQSARELGIDGLSDKPAFQALLYPAQPKDRRLSESTPPAFLACGADDRPDIAQGLPELDIALSRLHVPTELHVYARTGHGFGMRPSNPQPVSAWPDLFLIWLKGVFATPASLAAR
jgi:acetyl esterase/lipase